MIPSRFGLKFGPRPKITLEFRKDDDELEYASVDLTECKWDDDEEEVLTYVLNKNDVFKNPRISRSQLRNLLEKIRDEMMKTVYTSKSAGEEQKEEVTKVEVRSNEVVENNVEKVSESLSQKKEKEKDEETPKVMIEKDQVSEASQQDKDTPTVIVEKEDEEKKETPKVMIEKEQVSEASQQDKDTPKVIVEKEDEEKEGEKKKNDVTNENENKEKNQDQQTSPLKASYEEDDFDDESFEDDDGSIPEEIEDEIGSASEIESAESFDMDTQNGDDDDDGDWFKTT